MTQPVFLYAGLCGLMLLLLSARVVQGRVVFRIDFGDGGDEVMQRRIRVQANFVEYVPMALILLYAVQKSGFSAWIVHAIGVVLVAARVLHAAGLGRSSGISALRFLGSAATFTVLLFGSALALLGAFGIRF